MRRKLVAATASGVLGAASGSAAQPCDPLVWRQAAVGPGPRFAAAMATDERRGTVLLFGGLYRESVPSSLNDTWEWRGDRGRWVHRTPQQSPAARDSAAMAYDPDRGIVVLMGGDLGGVSVPEATDTWEWNGYTGTWTLRAATSAIGKRQGAAMVFDPVSRRIVLFAGYDDSETYYNDMWEWDPGPGEWLPRPQIDPPPVRGWSGMGQDPATGRFILFGGIGGPTVGTDTWEWDSATGQWLQLVPATVPPRRNFHVLTTDWSRGKVVLFGGGASPVFLGDTWEWDSAARDWSQRASTGPEGRSYAAAAYDPLGEQLVMVGGRMQTGGVGLAGTWLYDGDPGAWSRSAEGFPPSADRPKMAYDPFRGRTVLARPAGSPWYTWEWDGSAWSGGVTPGAGTFDASPVFDGIRVIMVGSSGCFVPCSTWGWDGHRWAELLGPSGPPPRSFHSVSYDSHRKRVVLFGGANCNTEWTDTWEWDGQNRTWARRFPITASPPSRTKAAMVYDPVGRRTILSGGIRNFGYLTDTWEWNGTDWRLLSTTGPSGEDFALYFDPDRGAVVAATQPNRMLLPDGSWQALPSGLVVSPGAVSHHVAARQLVALRGHETFVRGCDCYVNCDGSLTEPLVNVADVACFLTRYAAGDRYANCDNSTTPPVINAADFVCFMNRFAVGCQ